MPVKNCMDDLVTLITEEAGGGLEAEDHAADHAPGAADDLFGAAKATPVAADPLVIKDSEDTDAIATATIAQVGDLMIGAAKVAPVVDDKVVIQDTEDTDAIGTATITQILDLFPTAAKATPVGADKVMIQDSAAADARKSATIAAIQAAIENTATVQEIAEDDPCEIESTDVAIYLVSSTTGTKAITVGSSRKAQRIQLRLVAASGGSYTLAVTGGTLTLDAAGEVPVIFRNNADDAWLVLDLGGATVV